MKVLAVILLVAGVAAAAEIKDWKLIASVWGTDRITQTHITNLLLSHDIESVMEGSVSYSVSVPPPKAEQATKLLRADAPNRGYYVWFGSNDVVRAAKRKTIARRTAVSSILKKPEFAGDTALGRFLRSKEITELAAKYPYMISMSVYERQYLATPKTYATGYDVEIELQKSVRKQDDGYRGSYQVYDGGRSVDCFGSSEWKAGE